MNQFIVSSFVLLLAFAAVSQDCLAADVALIADNGDFTLGSSWSDGEVPFDDGDSHFIQNNLSAQFSGGSTTVTSLFVSDTSPGTLEMSGGLLTVTGDGESFAIGRSREGDGVVNLTGNAVLMTGTSFVGQRDRGVLNIGPNAVVTSTGDWRVGQFGPSVDFPPGLEGNGLLNVQGSFTAHTLYLGVDDGDGVLRVSGNGSVHLTGQLVPNVNTFYPNRSATVNVIGSSVTLSARDLESENALAEVHNLYIFEADGGGVSSITLLDAINITNNRLDVDLSGFVSLPGSSLTLFDSAPNRIFGQFSEVNIAGANPADFTVVYDQDVGEIRLVNTSPALGDMNGDVAVNNLDIAPFSLALTNRAAYDAQYPGLFSLARADINTDGSFNNLDIAPFASLLTGAAPVPEPPTLLSAALACVGLWMLRRRA